MKAITNKELYESYYELDIFVLGSLSLINLEYAIKISYGVCLVNTFYTFLLIKEDCAWALSVVYNEILRRLKA